MSTRDWRLVTLEQLDILRHSLGLSSSKRAYRNYFVAGGDDVRVCRELVALGLMIEGRASDLTGGPLFHVTDTGKKLAQEIR